MPSLNQRKDPSRLAKISEQTRRQKPHIRLNQTDTHPDPPRSISGARFKQLLLGQFFVRFHMLLILTGTGLSGVSISKLLLVFGVESMAIRYPIAVICSYFVFFCLIRLWLWYIAMTPARHSRVEIVEGTGESWIEAAIDQSIYPGVLRPSSPTEESSFPSREVDESLFGLELDDEGIYVLIIIALLLLTIFGGAVYLIYQAPVILAEAAFQAALASALTRASMRIDRGDWMGSVIGATWVPFILVLVTAVVFGLIVSIYCPAAIKLSEIFLCM
jgi:hypothetical protein